MIKQILAALLAGTLGVSLFAENPRGNDAPEPCPPEAADFDESEPPPPPPHIRQVSQQEIQMLKTLFSMSDKELARMRELISRLERTPEAKRREMARDLDRATSDNAEDREKFMADMRSRFESRRKNLLERYYATLPEAQAKAEAEAFLKMSKREQFEYLQDVRDKLGFPKKKNGKSAGKTPPRGEKERVPEH